MPAVGNDIVDLEAPGNSGKGRDARFLDRVFTERERLLIAGAAHPDLLLWTLWAAKEAAYKAVSRGDPAVCSIPRRYAVFLDSEGKNPEAAPLAGRVVTPRGEVALKVVATAQWVHALAAGEIHPDRLCHDVGGVDGAEDPSAAARGNLLQEIGRYTGCSSEEFCIVKDPDGPGVPHLLFRGRVLAVEVSLSHDGRFAAFAFDPVTLRRAIRAARAKF